MLRSVILAAARSSRAQRLVEALPLTHGVVRRCIAGESIEEVLDATREVVATGLAATLDLMAPDAMTPAAALANLDEYQSLLTGLSSMELTPAAEISVKLGALGLALDKDAVYEHAHAICAQASEAGTTVTLDAEDHTATDMTMEILERLRVDFPTTGIVVQACLRRAETDCAELARAGCRIRLCKRVYTEPEAVAFQARLEVDRSFVRCLNIVMSGEAYPMVATHDLRLVAIAEDRAKWFGRTSDQFEFQMLRGMCQDAQLRLAAAGYTVRAYLPFGEHWYACLMRRLADRRSKVDSVLRVIRP